MVGSKVNSLRKAKGMTLQQLGETAGLSASFLSQVERGRAFPTVISLASIAQALGVSPSYFFPPPHLEGPVVRSYERHPFRLQDHHVVYARLGGDFDGRCLEPLLVTYPPHFDSEVFNHVGEEFCILLEGRVAFTIDGDQHVLAPGDSMHFRSNRTHKVSNPTDEPAQLVFVNTPPYLT